MTPWLDFVRAHAPEGPLRRWAREDAALLAADRDDPRVAQLAATATARIVFGSDAAIEAIERLPHPAGSLGFGFGDRRSEAWIEPAAMTDATVRRPRPRLRHLRTGGLHLAAARRAARRLARRCARPARRARGRVAAGRALDARRCTSPPRTSPPRQRAAVAGWDAVLTPGNAATLAAGAPGLPVVESPMGLFVCAATREEAVATAPGNLQTVGHVVADPADPAWVGWVACAGAKRFVPLRAMHHFGPVWDGHAFWRALFEDLELVA